MILDRKTLLAVIFADIFIMLGATFILWDRVELAQAHLPNLPVAAVPMQNPAASAAMQATQPALQSEVPSMGESAFDPSGLPAESPASLAASVPEPPPMATRRIRFSYRNSIPSRVEIIGDFNKWQPQPMTRGKNFEWYVAIPLRPGEYTYNFIVDGKVIRDPNNPRTASEGRSLLNVKPLTE